MPISPYARGFNSIVEPERVARETTRPVDCHEAFHQAPASDTGTGCLSLDFFSQAHYTTMSLPIHALLALLIPSARSPYASGPATAPVRSECIAQEINANRVRPQQKRPSLHRGLIAFASKTARRGGFRIACAIKPRPLSWTADCIAILSNMQSSISWSGPLMGHANPQSAFLQRLSRPRWQDPKPRH